jgi:hypothetical protein
MKKKDPLFFDSDTTLFIDHYFVTQSSFVTSHKALSSCRLERKTKSGNEAGNGTTETEIGTHGEGGAADLTGVKVEEDLVGHVVHIEIWIETDEEGQVCFPIKIIYSYLLIL